MHNIGFKVDKGVQKDILTAKQIELVNEARKQIKENPDQFLDWEDVRKTINVD